MHKQGLLSRELPELFSSGGEEVAWEENSLLFREGESPSLIYLILSGIVAGVREKSGQKTGLFLGGEGTVLGSHAITSPRYIYSAQCITPVKAIALQVSVVREILYKAPQQSTEIFALVMAEAETIENWIAEMMSIKIEERILKVLKQLYQSTAKERLLIEGVDEKLMATLVCSSPAYVRRRVFSLQQKGLIRYSRGRLYYTSKLIAFFAQNE